MRCVLHIGTEKTGTTSLQAALLAQNSGLAQQSGLAQSSGHEQSDLIEQGVFYSQLVGNKLMDIARFALDEQKKQGLLTGLHNQPLDSLDAWREQYQQKWQQEIESIPEGVHTYLISSEFLAWELNSPKELLRIKEFLAQFFEQVDIVVYLRRQDRFALSFFSTVLKNGQILPRIFPEQPFSSTRYNYFLLLTLWSKVFGRANVQVFSYDSLKQKQQTIVEHFCQNVLELQQPINPAKAISSNPSLKSIAIPAYAAFIKRKQEKNLGYPALKRFNAFMEQHYAGKMQINRHEAEQYFQRFKEDNAMIERLFGLSELFDEDFSEYPEQAQKDYNEMDLAILGFKFMDFKNNK